MVRKSKPEKAVICQDAKPIKVLNLLCHRFPKIFTEEISKTYRTLIKSTTRIWFVCGCYIFRRGKRKCNVLLMNILGSIQSTKAQWFEGTWSTRVQNLQVQSLSHWGLAAEGLGNPGKLLLFSPRQSLSKSVAVASLAVWQQCWREGKTHACQQNRYSCFPGWWRLNLLQNQNGKQEGTGQVIAPTLTPGPGVRRVTKRGKKKAAPPLKRGEEGRDKKNPESLTQSSHHWWGRPGREIQSMPWPKERRKACPRLSGHLKKNNKNPKTTTVTFSLY